MGRTKAPRDHWRILSKFAPKNNEHEELYKSNLLRVRTRNSTSEPYKDGSLFLSARPLYMFVDCDVWLHFQRFGDFSSNFTTTGRPFDLCPECDTAKSGVVFAESFISPTSLTY